MNDPAFFGYGSLVNCATHSYTDPRPAVLRGWRRVWQATNLRKVAYLSVIQDADCTLDGLVAQVPKADWAALDKREAAYLRQDVTGSVDQAAIPVQTAVYHVAPTLIVASRQHPILLSYLDVVVQGYLQMFGNAGVDRFFETTSGWDTPILDDRANPIYPRHRRLSSEQTALVDHHLAAVMKKAE
jgi:hypothetical protein